jgi:hypothetical protein
MNLPLGKNCDLISSEKANSTDNTQNQEYNLNFYKIFLDDLIKIMDCRYDRVEICKEIFLLLSYLSEQDSKFKIILQSNQYLMKIIQKIINEYSVNIIFIF